MFKIEDEKTVAEEFAEQAKFFTEVRLLQRDVKIVLEGASNQNLLGTVIHPVSLSVIYLDFRLDLDHTKNMMQQ